MAAVDWFAALPEEVRVEHVDRYLVTLEAAAAPGSLPPPGAPSAEIPTAPPRP
jgi:hypothetical protein